MKRSPLNNAVHGGRPRHSPYNWKNTHESACGRGYHAAEGSSYQRFPAGSAGPQPPRDDNFIPLDVSTPKYNAGNNSSANNRYSGRGSPSGGGWYNNYRGNYHATPRSNCGNRYPAYKHSPKQFRGQKRKDYKGAHRQVNISAYMDMNSFLEDPWQDLVKKLDDSKGTSRSESLSNSKLVDSDLVERSRSELSKDTNLDDSQCSRECEDADTSFEMNTDVSQITKVNSSIESDIGDVCSSQDSLNDSTCNAGRICAAMREDSIHSNASLTDINQKDI